MRHENWFIIASLQENNLNLIGNLHYTYLLINVLTTVVLKYSDLNNLVEAIKFMYFGMERSSSIELIVLQPFSCNLLHLYTDTFTS